MYELCVKVNSSFRDNTNVESSVPQGPVCRSFFCDLFCDDINIDLVNYADDKTPYVFNPENKEIIKLFAKKKKKREKEKRKKKWYAL